MRQKSYCIFKNADSADTDTGSTDATDLEWLRDSADSKVYWIQIFKIYLYTK